MFQAVSLIMENSEVGGRPQCPDPTRGCIS